ncbi:MAG TPA: hypothetical protein ENI95_08890 [Chloroflexi bacterium]|nr:hypothetical protein [Chloroflexota bacterium]
MSDEYNGYDEAEAAEDRIRRIRKKGAAGAPPPRGAGLDEVDSEALRRARARARRTRGVVEQLEEEEVVKPRARPARTGGRGQQALLFIGGIVVVGILIVGALFLVSGFLSGEGGGLPDILSRATDTPTPTPTPEATATPTPTETPSPTPTREAPRDLGLPPLECLYTGPGCYDFCQNPDNQATCEAARQFLSAQRVDPDAWFECVAPGPGPNVGNPQECLEEAWRVANP